MELPHTMAPSNDSRIKIAVAPVSIRSVQRSVESVGTLHGFEEITLSSKVEGRVIKIHYDLASVVKPGQVLLELDPPMRNWPSIRLNGP